MVQQNDTSEIVPATSFWSILINTKIVLQLLAVIAVTQEEPRKLSVFFFTYLMVSAQLWCCGFSAAGYLS